MRRALSYTIVVGSLLSSAAYSRSTEDVCIQRVESELLPVTAIRDNLGSHATIHERLRAFGVPGLSVAVIENGRLAWARAYGVADTRTGRAVTSETLFQAASISKPIAALGALLLVERGKLDLDRDVNPHLKGWKIPQNAYTAAHPVTLRTLLDHSAALTDTPFDNYERGLPLPALAELLKVHSPPIRVESEPGRNYSYSGTGYVVLQQLMVDVTGQPFEEFMEQQVLRPLGMAHSTFADPLAKSLGRSVAMGHYSGGERVAGGYRVGPELAVAGLWTTPSDLARYIIEVQQWHAASRRGLLSTDMTRQMLSPQIAYAGLGVVLSGSTESVRFGHDGFNEGFEASMVGYVRGGQGAVVMANSGFAYMLLKEVLGSIARVYEWPHYDSTNQWPPSAAIAQQETTPIPDDVTSSAVGRYALDANTSVRVFARKSRLYLEWPRSGVAEIFATTDGRLFCPQLTFSELGDPFLRLRKAPDGLVEALLGADGQAVLRRVQ
jgi:CubicO group peptidase (beta-lactamase class C family)